MKVPRDVTSYVRVLKMASTPTSEEFSQVAKVAGLGILLIGTIGFVIFVGMSFLPATVGV
ncbi:MAG: protein translocase SEC61 complex subunit gamma [Halobacteriales archaeon]